MSDQVVTILRERRKKLVDVGGIRDERIFFDGKRIKFDDIVAIKCKVYTPSRLDAISAPPLQPKYTKPGITIYGLKITTQYYGIGSLFGRDSTYELPPYQLVYIVITKDGKKHILPRNCSFKRGNSEWDEVAINAQNEFSISADSIRSDILLMRYLTAKLNVPLLFIDGGKIACGVITPTLLFTFGVLLFLKMVLHIEEVGSMPYIFSALGTPAFLGLVSAFLFHKNIKKKILSTEPVSETG